MKNLDHNEKNDMQTFIVNAKLKIDEMKLKLASLKQVAEWDGLNLSFNFLIKIYYFIT